MQKEAKDRRPRTDYPASQIVIRRPGSPELAHSQEPKRSPKLDRVAFRTSRLLEVAGRRGLTAQIGMGWMTGRSLSSRSSSTTRSTPSKRQAGPRRS